MIVRTKRPWAPDAGATTVEAAVLLPFLLLLTMLVVQAGIWFYATALATTAANHGVDAARLQDGSAADGHDAATQFLDEPGVLRTPSIEVVRDDETASVTVSGDVASLMFGIPFSVTATAHAPVERVLP